MSWVFLWILHSKLAGFRELTAGYNSRRSLPNLGWWSIRSFFPSSTVWVEGGKLAGPSGTIGADLRGFVLMSTHREAVLAMNEMNGKQIE